jgi:FtsZ-interacting cell division protein ZipA
LVLEIVRSTKKYIKVLTDYVWVKKMVAIPQNTLLIIIGVLVIVVLIVVVLLRRRGGKNTTNMKYLIKEFENETEIKKRKLIRTNQESKKVMSELEMPRELEYTYLKMKEDTSDIHKAEYFNNNINQRLNNLEAQSYAKKLDKLFSEQEKKEKNFAKKLNKQRGKLS